MIEIGETVLYRGESFKVLGYAASEDINGDKLIEIAWNNYQISPTGYLAVPAGELSELPDTI